MTVKSHGNGSVHAVPVVSLLIPSQPLHTPQQPSLSPSPTHTQTRTHTYSSWINSCTIAAQARKHASAMLIAAVFIHTHNSDVHTHTHTVTCVEHMCTLSGHRPNDILFDFTYSSRTYTSCKPPRTQSSCQGRAVGTDRNAKPFMYLFISEKGWGGPRRKGGTWNV